MQPGTPSSAAAKLEKARQKARNAKKYEQATSNKGPRKAKNPNSPDTPTTRLGEISHVEISPVEFDLMLGDSTAGPQDKQQRVAYLEQMIKQEKKAKREQVRRSLHSAQVVVHPQHTA